MTISFNQITLLTGDDGKARFAEKQIPLSEGTDSMLLSPLLKSDGYQIRHSPIGFRSPFHCTLTPQWVFILHGQMEIGLQDGRSRIFKPGEHFYSNDRLPDGAVFDPALHGHWSAQVGDEALVTLFVRDATT